MDVVDTGVPLLIRACCLPGAKADPFQIGKRNFPASRQLLRRAGLVLHALDVGGTQPRTMLLEIGTGRVILRVNGEERAL